MMEIQRCMMLPDVAKSIYEDSILEMRFDLFAEDFPNQVKAVKKSSSIYNLLVNKKNCFARVHIFRGYAECVEIGLEKRE